MEKRTTWVISLAGRRYDGISLPLGTYALLSKAPLSSLVDQILAVRGQSHFQEIYIAGEIAGRGVQKGVALVAIEVRNI